MELYKYISRVIRIHEGGYVPYFSDKAPNVTQGESLVGILKKFPIKGKEGGPGGKGKVLTLSRNLRSSERTTNALKAPMVIATFEDIYPTYPERRWR